MSSVAEPLIFIDSPLGAWNYSRHWLPLEKQGKCLWGTHSSGWRLIKSVIVWIMWSTQTAHKWRLCKCYMGWVITAKGWWTNFQQIESLCQPVKWTKASSFLMVYNRCFYFSDFPGGGKRQRSEQPEQQAPELASWHQEPTWCLQETGKDLAGESALCGGGNDDQQPRECFSSCYPPLLPWAGTVIESSSTRAFFQQAVRKN